MNNLHSNLEHIPAPTVKRLLRERGYTLTAVARMLGVSQVAVSQVVRRKITSRRIREKILELIKEEPANVA